MNNGRTSLLATFSSTLFAGMFLFMSIQGNENHSEFEFRTDWEHRVLKTDIAERIAKNQKDCTKTSMLLHPLNNYGMGSGLWNLGTAVCSSLEEKLPLHVLNDTWIWLDKDVCSKHFQVHASDKMLSSPLDCYFGKQFNQCANDVHHNSGSSKPVADAHKHAQWINVRCPSIVQDEGNVTAYWNLYGGFFEYLFSSLTPSVIESAKDAAYKTFNSTSSPDDMITVHIRWGDKSKEMGGLVPIHKYMSAIDELIRKHDIRGKINILLATYDTEANQEFRNAVKKRNFVKANQSHWNVFQYEPAAENLLSLQELKRTSYATATAANPSLHTGIQSLIEWLLAVESKYFVLTTASNWSAVIEALRLGVLNTDCGQCTDSIDLKRNRLWIPSVRSFNRKHKIDEKYVKSQSTHLEWEPST